MSMRTDNLICSFVFHDDSPDNDLLVVGTKLKNQTPEPIHAVKGPEVLEIYHRLRGENTHGHSE